MFADAILRLKRQASKPDDIGLFNVRLGSQGTVVEPFDTSGPLFRDTETAEAVPSRAEDGLFERLILRGLVDE